MARPLPAPIADRLRANLWLLPSVMLIGSILCARALIHVDANWHEPGLFKGAPGAARTVLAAAVSSLATIAGVTFSMTLLAISFSSSALGPRLLRNFIRRPTQQAAVGACVSSIGFCFVVLVSIRGPAEDEFVPELSIITALVVSALSLLVLILFLHRTAFGIQADNVVQELADKAQSEIVRYFDSAGWSEAESGELDLAEELVVKAPGSGYVQGIEWLKIQDLAVEHAAVIELTVAPGDHVLTGDVLARAHHLDAEAVEVLGTNIHIGSIRTEEQDPFFAVHEIVEIALRAQSPGVCDPYTAMVCIDRLGGILALVLNVTDPGTQWTAEGGDARVYRHVPGFDRLVSLALNQLRQNADVAVAIRILHSLSGLMALTQSEDRKRMLHSHAHRTMESGLATATSDHDRSELRTRAHEIFALIPSVNSGDVDD